MKPIARKIYDPSQHTLEKKNMEFMASIIFIFFSIKCKKLNVYQQNVLFHQTNTRSKVFILHLNCFISFFIHYIWVILISNNPSLSQFILRRLFNVLILISLAKPTYNTPVNLSTIFPHGLRLFIRRKHYILSDLFC